MRGTDDLSQLEQGMVTRWLLFKHIQGCTCNLTNGGGIRRIVQSNRATFYCGARQR